ncbi:hypothetical protein INH39_22565 [Massilia violaceinigra]|uniref:Flagellar hook-length control protein FliK n=1 Tax=Massilia violaceinigra TaxID=2045208 RepID=A0ABY4A0S8_9BURK|nr:hypothetical protein [Massilia violaceinigra]UOD28227.1 hypothetical protein INH39_22565 [Massilia violaceinigra]
MDISQITAPAARAASLVAPVATSRTVAIEQAQNLSFLGVAPTTVDLSSSGRFLSLASLFQKKTLDLQTSVAANTDTSKAFADAAVSAAAMAGAFTELQTSAVDSNGLPTDSLDGQSLQSQFFQQLGGTPDDAEASLAAIGLTFSPATGTAPGALSVDETLLEDAFGQDPGATSALLERAAGAFLNVVGTQIQAQVANLSFLDDDSVFGAALPLPGAVPQDIAAAPSYPMAQPASYTDNMFLQNLVSESLRTEDPLPVPVADLIGDDVFPMQANPIASPQAEAVAAGALAEAPVAAAIAASSANVVPADVRQPATPGATVAPPAAAAAPAAQDRLEPLPPGTTPAAATAAEPDTTASNAAGVAQQARVLAQQLQAEREAARELDEKIAGASDAVRAALADDIARRDASRVGLLNAESARAQQRVDQPQPAISAPVAPERFARPADTVRPATAAQSATATPDADRPTTPQPPLVPAPEQALLAARDPAIAAAIAAYHINTGPFAAQNGRPETPPPKARPVAPVAAVTRVDAAEALGTPGDASAPLR